MPVIKYDGPDFDYNLNDEVQAIRVAINFIEAYPIERLVIFSLPIGPCVTWVTKTKSGAQAT